MENEAQHCAEAKEKQKVTIGAHIKVHTTETSSKQNVQSIRILVYKMLSEWKKNKR